jgi:hypothetical protein
MADDFALLGLGVDSSNAVNGLRAFTRETGNLVDTIKRAMPVVAGLFSARAIFGASRGFISAAAEMQEAAGVLDDVFGSSQKLMKRAGDAIEELADRYAYSTAGASQQVSMTADTFNKFGVELEKSLDLSVVINKLGADLAAFTNYVGGSEGATHALTKALIGERESAKALGIVITEESVKTQMEKEAKEGLTYATQQQAKMMATLSIIQQQASAAQGKAIKEADNYTTKIRNLAGKFTDLKAALGETIIDPFTDLVSGVTNAIDWFKGLDRGWRMAIVQGGLLIGTTGLLAGAYKSLTFVINAMTASLTRNTAAQVANNAARGAGGAAAGGGMLAGVGGTSVMVAAAVGAGLVSNFLDGVQSESQKGKATGEKIGFGIANGVTLGLMTIREKWAQAGQAADPAIEKAKVLGNTLTLGISGATDKVAKMLGITKMIGDLINAFDDDYLAAAEESKRLDSANAAEQQRQAAVASARTALGAEMPDYTATEEWQAWQKRQDALQGRAGLSGVEGALADYGIASDALDEANKKYQEAENSRLEAVRKTVETRAALEEKSAQLAQKQLEVSEDVGKGYKRLGEITALEEQVAQLNADYMNALADAESLTNETLKEVTEERTKSMQAFAAASESYRAALVEDLVKTRQQRMAEEDSDLSRGYIGLSSDEASGGRAGAERDLLSNRLKEMEEAAYNVRMLEEELKNTEGLEQRLQIQENLDLEKAVAGTLEERLALSDQILQKRVEEEQAAARVAQREEEVLRARGERNKELQERAKQMATDYAEGWMTDAQRVRANQARLRKGAEEGYTFSDRESALVAMDTRIKALGETIAKGGEAGRKAEEEMNRLVKERAREEEKLNADKSKSLDEQYAALNAIDAIAESKANEYAQEYQEQLDRMEAAERSDRKPVGVQQAIDAASAEGFAQLNKIYDTSQKKIEDNTKGIKEYTRQMKQYLMELAAQGKSDWALDVEGA